ncbi:hypothetical protein AOLI_G00243610 [Acnodon oligacanthus]
MVQGRSQESLLLRVHHGAEDEDRETLLTFSGAQEQGKASSVITKDPEGLEKKPLHSPWNYDGIKPEGETAGKKGFFSKWCRVAEASFWQGRKERSVLDRFESAKAGEWSAPGRRKQTKGL